MVKNLFLTKSALMAVLLSPLLAHATSDEYPAADFQPKVLYSDSGYKHSGSAPSSSGAGKTKFDPDYPAAAFEPKVLYKDSGYKHKADKVTSSRSSSTASTASSASVDTASAEAESSDQTMLIGVVVLAVLGFFFYRKNADTAAPKARAPRRRPAPKAPVAAAEAPEGATRVEKYLAKKQPQTTRVAKYLQDKEKSLPSTGVAKYLAKQVVRSRQLAEEKVTGVEKYLRRKKG